MIRVVNTAIAARARSHLFRVGVLWARKQAGFHQAWRARSAVGFLADDANEGLESPDQFLRDIRSLVEPARKVAHGVGSVEFE